MQRHPIKSSILLMASGTAIVLVCLLVVFSLRAGRWMANPFHFSTTVTPTGPVVLQQVQQLQRLETCRYNGQVIVRGDTESILPQWMAGDHLLFVGSGEVVAGMDLMKLKQADVQVEKNSVTLHLPPAEIFHTRLDNKQSQVYERRTGLFSKPDKDLETKVRLEAEERIQKAALESGLLKTATRNAQDTLKRQLQMLGFKDVKFN